ncbi:MAG: protein kinase [Gemmatimonadota bacterium]
MDLTRERLAVALAGRYEIERELARGGMATVYVAADLRHHRRVAIKVLFPELGAALGTDRFLREIEVAARLQHPNIVPLLDSGEAGELFFYVMPLIEGESLRERLARDGALPVREATGILREVADALTHAHARGVVHRDIKPGNILLSGRHALVLDFGVARAVTEATRERALTATGLALGTPGYMAPEQALADREQDHRVDIYALGVVGYEMLTGRSPFEGTSVRERLAAQVTLEPEPLGGRDSAVPPGLARVVMRCLAKEPDDRWQSSEELLAELDLQATPRSGSMAAIARGALARRRRALRRAVSPRRVVIAVAALALIAAATLGGRRYARVQWARTVAIPEIRRLVEERDWGAAHDLALAAGAVLGDDPALDSLWSAFSRPARIESDPPGALVYRRAHAGGDTAWAYAGTTPVDGLALPLGPAFSRLMLVKDGYDTVADLVASAYASEGETWRYPLDPAGALPPGMVRVPAGGEELLLWGLDDLPPLDLPSYLIGRYEVTNREFQRFVDAGGYRDPGPWRYPFVGDGVELTREQAMARFVDRTGRPGPSTWEVGTYPDGQEDHPVTGVSWHEAAAYARWAGSALPTVFHWARAARIWTGGGVVPVSNMDRRHGGTLPVGRANAVGGFGLYDMAGNAREWVLNEAEDGRRYILGGSWDESAYGFASATATSPLDRSASNGFRLATYPESDGPPAEAGRAVAGPRRDFRIIPPVSDAVFATYARRYDYDRGPLDAVVEETDSTAADRVMQKVTFDAAYGDERVIAYLFLPRNREPPWQTVVFFPGDGCIAARSSRELRGLWTVDFVLRSGRALLHPVYKSCYERGDGLTSSMPAETHAYAAHVEAWAKDLRRSIDYLETRGDIDTARLAYYGYSWGGRLGPIMLAVEPRLKAAVLNVAGLRPQRAFPEAEPVYFLPRVDVPVLMLNGRYDYYFPLESSQQPMFDLLGTPPEHKRHVVAEGSHYVPLPVAIRETLDWLDRYLGPVR